MANATLENQFHFAGTFRESGLTVFGNTAPEHAITVAIDATNATITDPCVAISQAAVPPAHIAAVMPKRYDAPWKDIENQGWIAPADCSEVRVTLTDAERMAYATAEPEDKYKLAATARTKLPVISAIVDQHPDDQVLVIGAYLEQLEEIAGAPGRRPIIQGSTPNRERERLYDSFRSGETRVLVVGARWQTSSSTCPRRRWRSRSRAPSAPGRRRPSGWDGCCGPRARRAAGALLHGGQPRQPGRRVRRAPPAVPGRAGLRLHHPRRRRPGRAPRLPEFPVEDD